MIHGHGDDIFNYPEIRSNFSSNIFTHADLAELKAHLCSKMGLISHYPEPEPHSLSRVIAEKYGISPDNILVTNGATDAIYLIAQTIARSQYTHYETGTLPTFSEYEDASRMSGLIPRINEGMTASGMHTVRWLCNPNNPTGDVYTKKELEDITRLFGLVVIDQSYEDYTLAAMMTHCEAAESENIIQIHSLTKTYAIPGLRIGYITAPQHLITQLRENARPWAVNALAIEAGKWLMENDVRIIDNLEFYLSETQRLRGLLNKIPGIYAQETQTNFILAKSSSMTAALLKDRLARQYYILIRDASNIRGLTPYHFRVSTQTPAENDQLAEAIRKIMTQ